MIERCLAPAEIQAGDLLAYVEGEASPAVARHIARCPVCAAEVEGLREMENLFAQALSAASRQTNSPLKPPPNWQPVNNTNNTKFWPRSRWINKSSGKAGICQSPASGGNKAGIYQSPASGGKKLKIGTQPLLALSLLLIIVGSLSFFYYLSDQATSSVPPAPLVAAETTLEAAVILEEAARPDVRGLRLAKQAAYDIPLIAGIEAGGRPTPGHGGQYPVAHHKIVDVSIAERIIVEENFDIAPPLDLRRDLAQKTQAEPASFLVGNNTADFRHKSSLADNLGNRYVVEVDNDHGNASLYFTASIDRGRTWRSATKIYSGVGRLFNPHLAIDDDQTLYVVWQNWRNIDRYDFYFARSTNGGRSWSEAVRIDDTTKRTVNPKLTIDADGVLFVTWQKRHSLNTGLYATHSTDGGQTWSDGVRLLNIGS